MSLPRLIARTPSARRINRARLYQHELRFHKRSADGSAKCDAFFTGEAQDVVFGVVFDIDPKQKTDLDACEGLGRGYQIRRVSVRAENGVQIQAFTYYATDIDATRQPYAWYKQHVLAGARMNNLPQEYIQRIELVPAGMDPDAERHHRELAIYG